MSVLILLCASFALGVGIGNLLPTPSAVALPAVLSSLGLALVALRRGRSVGISLTAAALISGWIRAPSPAPTQDPGDPCERAVEGTIIVPPEAVESGIRTVLELHEQTRCLRGAGLKPFKRAHGRLYLYLPTDAATKHLGRGDRLLVRGRLVSLQRPHNPGIARGHDSSLFRMTLRNSDAAVRLDTGFGLRHPFDERRAEIAAFVDSTLDSPENAAAKALLLGETADLPFAVRRHFRRAGCAHLLAVSGLHLAIAAFLSFFLARTVLLRTPSAARGDPGRLAAIAALLPTVCFTLITGAEIPVIRACIMTAAALLARFLQRPQGSIEAFFLAAAAILCASPEAASEAGFQLSFAAVGGFFFVFAHKEQTDFQTPPEPGTIRRLLASVGCLFRASIAASAATAPIGLHHFGSISWVAPLSNLFAVPLTSLILMPILLASAMLESIFPSAAAVLLRIAGPILSALDRALSLIAAGPCTLESPGVFATAAVWIIAVALLFAAAKRIRIRTTVCCCIAAVGIPLLADAPPLTPDRLTVHFFDVGQGDAALISTPKGRHLLVDGGPAFRSRIDAGERIVVPALRALGATDLEIVLATHPDSDHIGGLATVIQSVSVRQLFDNGQGTLKNTPLYQKMLRAAEAEGISISRTPTICGPHKLDGVRFEVLHPCDEPTGYDKTADTNDNSLVLRITYGRVSLLMLGDVGASVEERLAKSGRLSNIDVLKLSHHGSRSATGVQLLDTAQPAAAIISVGRHNRFGMPHPSVLKRLSDRNIRVRRTDREGAIVLRTDGRVIELSNIFGR